MGKQLNYYGNATMENTQNIRIRVNLEMENCPSFRGHRDPEFGASFQQSRGSHREPNRPPWQPLAVATAIGHRAGSCAA
jgi:hypothetical protein